MESTLKFKSTGIPKKDCAVRFSLIQPLTKIVRFDFSSIKSENRCLQYLP